MNIRYISIFAIGALFGGAAGSKLAGSSEPSVSNQTIANPVKSIRKIDTVQLESKQNNSCDFQYADNVSATEDLIELVKSPKQPPTEQFTLIDSMLGLPSYLVNEQFDTEEEASNYLEGLVTNPDINRHDRLDVLEIVLASKNDNSAKLVEDIITELMYNQEVQGDEIERGLQVIQQQLELHHAYGVALWLEHESERVRTMAIEALKNSGHSEHFIEQLSEMLQKDESLLVKEAAFLSLKANNLKW